jgi:hypothetical protein
MRSWLVLAAGLIATAAAAPVMAADIDGLPPPPPRSGAYGEPYNGPYGRPYGEPPRAPHVPPSYSDDDDDRYDGPPVRKYSYTPAPPRADDRYDGAPPVRKHSYTPAPPRDDDRYDGPPPVRKYSYAPPRHAAPPPVRGCVRSEQVRDRLTNEGWRDFHDGQPVSQTEVTLRARRPNGRLFELTLHRCTGELMEARPLQLRPFGPYAYRQPYGPYGTWRWGPQTAPYTFEESWPERPYADRGLRRWNGE